MLKKLFISSLIISLIIINSCSTIDVTSISSKAIALSIPGSKVKILGHFHESVRYWFTIGGLVNLNKPDIDEIFMKQLLRYNGDGICNLHLKDQYGGTDILISLGVGLGGYLVGYSASNGTENEKAVSASLGTSVAGLLVSSRTLYLEGDVYKLE
jgi:hypothetical protein